jgi:hypothetical protein
MPYGSIFFVILLVLVIGFLAQGIRGVLSTQMKARIPVHLAGAAAGIISSIGFAPDAFFLPSWSLAG